MSLDFDGAALNVFGSVNGTFAVNIDGQVHYDSNTQLSQTAQAASLFTTNTLSPGKHTITITNQDEGAVLFIDYISFTSSVAQKNGTLDRLVVDDIEPAFHYERVDAVGLYGTIGPDHGTYSVQLDDQPPQSYNAAQSTFAAQISLYYVTHLDAGNHTLHVVNEDNAVFDIDWANLATIANVTSTSISTGAIVGAAVGGVIALLIIVLGFLLCYRLSRKRSIGRSERTSSMSPYMMEAPPSSTILDNATIVDSPSQGKMRKTGQIFQSKAEVLDRRQRKQDKKIAIITTLTPPGNGNEAGGIIIVDAPKAL
ncbi:hypothetical protein C0991_012214 [Blastosporella zonata]|nr:hypothetical protein C0991_012214 [Blastosporella zonata]